MHIVSRINRERIKEYIDAEALRPYDRYLLQKYYRKIIPKRGNEVHIEVNDDMTPVNEFIATVHTRRDLCAVIYDRPGVELPPCTPIMEMTSIDDIYTVENTEEAIINFIHGCTALIINSGSSFRVLRYNRAGEWGYTFVTTAAFRNNGLSIHGVKLSDRAMDLSSLVSYHYVTCQSWYKEPIYTQNKFNLFTGFMHKYRQNFQVDEQIIAPVIQHLRLVWCENDPAKFEYVIHWLAWIIQRGNEKLPTFLAILPEDRGAGRHMMCAFLTNKVFGRGVSLTRTKKEEAVGKVLVITPPIKYFVEVLRQERIKIDKGGLHFSINDISNYIMLPERISQLRALHHGCRHLKLRAKKQPGDYYVNLLASLTDTAGEHFFHYLANIDVSDFNTHSYPREEQPPEPILPQIFDDMHPATHFLRRVVNQNPPELFKNGIMRISSNDLFVYFKDLYPNNTHLGFAREIGKVITPTRFYVGPKQVRGYEISREELARRLT